MSKFCIRINRPAASTDSDDEYGSRLISEFADSCFRDVVIVKEIGEKGENVHWHCVILDPKKRSRNAMSMFLRDRLKLDKGNGGMCVKEWDAEKGKTHYQYLAKGPTSLRLVMPLVVADQMGLMWERLHHAFHDEAASRRKRVKGAKPLTFTQELLVECKKKSVDTKKGIAAELCVLMTRRLQPGDAFWAEKVVWGVYAQLNGDEFTGDFMTVLSARMNF